MKTIADPATLERLVERLEALPPEAPSNWGTFTVGEMLCHLTDAAASVMTQGGTTPSRRPFLKWFALRAPLAWPRNLPTPDEVNPKARGTVPTEFESDRRRAIDSLRALAATPATELANGHGAFGPMAPEDWFIWAYRHVDHHLRQFGG